MAALLLAVWQVPQWLDWTRYRGTIEAFATARIGQPVTIRGPISLTLLPQPVLTAAQVDVGGNVPTDFAVHVDALRLRVALWPLLGGRVDARELVLRGPDLRLPWPAEPDLLRRRTPAWLAAFNARIENGRLTVGRLAFTGIDAAFATLETGAVSASGTAQFSGHGWHFTSRLTAAGADGAAGLNVTLDGQGKANGLGASFSGQVARDGSLSGAFGARGPSLAVLLPTPPVPFRADGRLTVGSGLAVIDDLALEIGGSPATGAVALRVSPNERLDIALSASRLDLDAWLPVLLRSGTTVAGIEVPIGIDFSAEAAPLGGGTLEHVRAAFELQGGSLSVREASARLPGNAVLRLSGRVLRAGPRLFRFEGDTWLNAPVLRTTLHWLEEAMPGALPPKLVGMLPAGVAQRAELAAHVLAGAGEIRLQQLKGSVDDGPIVGSFGLKHGEPPVFSADLTLDRLSLDGWLSRRPPVLTELAKSFTGLDGELRLGVKRATWAGTAIDGLMADVAIEASNMQLRRLEATVRGTRVVASGVLGADGRLSSGRLSAETHDASAVADLLPAAWQPTPALWNGPARLDAEAGGPAEALGLDVRLALADASVQTSDTINLKSGNWTGTLVLRHPGARRLVATLGLASPAGLRGLPSWLGDGSLSLVARLAGGAGRLAAESFDLTAATLHATGDLVLDQRSAAPHIAGRISLDALTLPSLDCGSGMPLPFDLLHGWRGDIRLSIGALTGGGEMVLRDASATVSVAHDAMRIDPFTARLGTGGLAGRLSVDAAADPPAVSLEAKVSDVAITGPLAGTPIDLQSGRASVSAQLEASGFSPSALMATLGGRTTVIVHDGAAAGFDLSRLRLAVENTEPKSAEVAAKEALSSGTTDFERLELAGSIAHGNLRLDQGKLSSAAGNAGFSGGVNLATEALDVRIAIQPDLPSPPEVSLHVTGPFGQPKRTPELAGLARWMAELAH